AFPANPEFGYVGPLPAGSLGNRAPERRLAATFGQLTTTAGREPKFVTAPLTEPLTIGGIGELVAFIQGPSEAVAGHLSADLIDVDPKGQASVIGETPKNIAVNASSAMPELTKVPIPVGTGYPVPAGHSLGVRIRLSFVGTSAHTLYYDSDKYPSGVSLQAGQVVTHEDCPPVIGAGPAPVSDGKGGDKPSTTTTTTTA